MNSPPRRSPQFDGSPAVQPSGRATHASVPAVEICTLTSCAGVPTWRVNVDHGPSLPSLIECQLAFVNTAKLQLTQYWLGETTIGAGTTVLSRRDKTLFPRSDSSVGRDSSTGSMPRIREISRIAPSFNDHAMSLILSP